MDQNKKVELKPCPFCGCAAEIHYQPVVTDMVVCVRCTECRSRVHSAPYDCNYAFYHGEKNVNISKERATRDAINRGTGDQTISRERQIVEIKECIDAVYGADCSYFDVDGFAIANEIYNAGYRKQSEGEWKKVYRNNVASVYECSNCGHLTFGTSDFCICGAKMKGGAE